MEIINQIVNAVSATDIGTGVTAAGLGSIKKDSLVGVFYEDLAQPSVKKLGLALSNVTELILVPTLLAKHGSDLYKANLAKRLDRYKANLDRINDETIIPVNPQIGVPIIEKLTYTTNDDIAELYLNLLTKGSSRDTVNEAHPAFIQIIERLTVDEGHIIQYLKGKNAIPYIDFRFHTKDGGHKDVMTYGTMLEFEKLEFPKNISIYLPNLISMGILQERSNEYLKDETLYEQLKEKHYYQAISDALLKRDEANEVECINGVFDITPFGKAFINACAII